MSYVAFHGIIQEKLRPHDVKPSLHDIMFRLALFVCMDSSL
jgi:hypothetical protein